MLAIAAGFGLWKLSASLATPAPKVLRLAVSIPASQGFVDASMSPATLPALILAMIAGARFYKE